jgi:large subunit ribosomal protein L24
MYKIKVGDKVRVMRGKEAGKEAEVLRVINTVNKRNKPVIKVVLKDINVMKRHVKPNPVLNVPGGIVEVERPIDISNVMLIDDKGKVTRVGFSVSKDGKKTRIFKSTGKAV